MAISTENTFNHTICKCKGVIVFIDIIVWVPSDPTWPVITKMRSATTDNLAENIFHGSFQFWELEPIAHLQCSFGNNLLSFQENFGALGTEH